MNKRSQAGSGLIEAMISIFVVSVGFLGFAGVQVNGLAAANDSLYRSKAIYLSYQMADRVRANMPAVQTGAYASMSGTGTSPGCIATGCTAAQVAQNDFYEWSTEVAAVLPTGTGTICKTSLETTCDGAGNNYAVTLTWTEKGVSHSFVTTFRP
jgi:type IV pilus assembly protein PilV